LLTHQFIISFLCYILPEFVITLLGTVVPSASPPCSWNERENYIQLYHRARYTVRYQNAKDRDKNQAQFTRYNLFSNRLSNRLLNPFDNRCDNRLDVCLHDRAGCQTGCTTGCQTGCTTGLTTVVWCKRGFTVCEVLYTTRERHKNVWMKTAQQRSRGLELQKLENVPCIWRGFVNLRVGGEQDKKSRRLSHKLSKQKTLRAFKSSDRASVDDFSGFTALYPVVQSDLLSRYCHVMFWYLAVT